MEIKDQLCRVSSFLPLLPKLQGLTTGQQTCVERKQTSYAILLDLKFKKKKSPYLDHKILKERFYFLIFKKYTIACLQLFLR